MKWTFDNTKRGYAKMWAKLAFDPEEITKIAKYVRLINAGEDQYKRVAAVLGVPWYFIGALHMRESGCDFRGVLHNGEHIIGTGRKTRLEPRDRGPFTSWEEAAIDALKLKGLQNVEFWPPERMAYEAERFNGLGYVNHGVNSPYVWGSSNLEEHGKFIADHVWDRDFDDPQVGVMTVIKAGNWIA